MTKQKLGLMALCLCMALGGSPDAFGAPASEKTEAAEAAGAVAPEAAASLVEVQAALDADNAEKAVELLKPLVKKKQPEAMYVMGRLALEGRGTRRSPVYAATLFQEAAQKGDIRAQNAIGTAYARGQGVKRHYGEEESGKRHRMVQPGRQSGAGGRPV